MTFQRESRYIVVKLKDLAPGQEADIREHLTELSAQPVDSLVIERDWPEYEPAWRMIQARVEGAPLSPAHIEDGEEISVVRVPSCENSYGFGYVDGSCHVDLRKYRNHLEDILDALPNDEPLMTVALHQRIVAALSAPPAAGVPEGSVYVECRQCDECQHYGINDAATGLAACHDCDWTGTDPVEDRCPGCDSTNCMAAACPKCGAKYALVASDDVAAPTPPASEQQRAVVMPERRTILDPADRYCCKEVACEAWNDAMDELLRLNPHLAKGEGV
ncbi:hypothetical protein [Pseudomonas sp. zfem003]|uniref:hypothetical protein n=1 Tax=Pseudomonas sp. zfem003 TaxID=3078198 RepID=UPI0029291F1C|nr:hypothetical protein [Pseudomonas sp. zfem003]MDU9399013.1 hypothetical protein [Pseudomonas sp. zfem003]